MAAANGKGARRRSAKTKPKEASVRATATAARLKHLAIVGFPPLDKLRARVDELRARIDEKLDAVLPERQQPAPATIAAPAALQYALLGDGDEVADLREMFENLLVAAMDRDTASSVHPAFVSMISQLAPDEARILKSIDHDGYALIDVHDFGLGGTPRPIESRTRLGIGIGIDEARQWQYLSNLDRLGILRTEAGSSAAHDHSALLADIGAVHSEVLIPMAARIPLRGVWATDKSIVVTPLGRQFLDTCVLVRS